MAANYITTINELAGYVTDRYMVTVGMATQAILAERSTFGRYEDLDGEALDSLMGRIKARIDAMVADEVQRSAEAARGGMLSLCHRLIRDRVERLAKLDESELNCPRDEALQAERIVDSLQMALTASGRAKLIAYADEQIRRVKAKVSP